VNLNDNLLKFVSDGLKFDHEVVRSSCAHTLSYNPTDLNVFFKNKTELSNNIKILQKTEQSKPLRKWPKIKAEEEIKAIKYQELIEQPTKISKFNLKNQFIMTTTTTSVKKSFTESQIIEEDESSDGVFLTEEPTKKILLEKKEPLTKSLTNLSINSDRKEKKSDWDDFLISKLSENTARWIIAKKTDSKLINLNRFPT
jgi:hypothetical protein